MGKTIAICPKNMGEADLICITRADENRQQPFGKWSATSGGRQKSMFFARAHHAAEMSAAMYSFMASCKKNKINEFDWLKDVFERIRSHKQKERHQILPSNWQEYRPQ